MIENNKDKEDVEAYKHYASAFLMVIAGFDSEVFKHCW